MVRHADPVVIQRIKASASRLGQVPRGEGRPAGGTKRNDLAVPDDEAGQGQVQAADGQCQEGLRKYGQNHQGKC